MPEPFAAESGHFYRADGTPCYSLTGKNGKERPTTLRDAKALNLYPSVTTILQVAAKPGLEVWKQRQVMLAALTLPRVPGETEETFVDRILADSKEQARKAAEKGTELHAAIEKSFRGEPVPKEWERHVEHVRAVIADNFGRPDWQPERSFASPIGYGGKVDLWAQAREMVTGAPLTEGIVIDFKTKEGDVSKVEIYPEVEMQLAAYAHGLGMPDARCAAVYVSRDKPQVAIREVDDVARSFRMFRLLLSYWQESRGYFPVRARASRRSWRRRGSLRAEARRVRGAR